MPLLAIPGLSLPPSAALPPVQLATFGVGDTLLIVVIALIVFGPKKLPEISRQIGKLLYEFRKASNDFKFQIEEELRAAEQAERQKQLTSQAATPQPATPVAMTAGETVSAKPASEGVRASEPATTAAAPETSPELTVQPPASGLPVSAQSPYRAAENAEGATTITAAGESLDQPQALEELQASAQEAVRAAAADPSYHPTGDSAASDPIPTHHG